MQDKWILLCTEWSSRKYYSRSTSATALLVQEQVVCTGPSLRHKAARRLQILSLNSIPPASHSAMVFRIIIYHNF